MLCTTAMPDPVELLAHDHEDINRRVIALGVQVRSLGRSGASSQSLATPLAELREQLFTHFAREEEGLFPFVAETAPDLAERVHAMEVAHDTICGALARMYHLAVTTAPVAAIAALLDRFEHVYAAHAETEREVLTSLQAKLDAAQRARLAALVDGL
jgi:iron-sulfur cluster repair protein YtfE (RIC family)